MTGLKQFYGDLTITRATQATSVNAPTLELISGAFTLSGNTILSTVNLAQLTTVGTLNFTALPALENLGLASGITSAESIIVSDTGLNALEGINVYRLKVFDVNNNGDLETIDSGLQKVTDSLSVAHNADKADVSFDQLTEAQSISFDSINSVSAPNLTKVDGGLSLSNSYFDKLEFKSLQTIGNSLSITTNDELEELDFPQLKSIGGALQIIDNEQLKSFDGFPKLSTIGGSVTLDGAFDNGTFDSLSRVAGGFNLTSTGDLSCADFVKLNDNGDIRGDKFYCKGASSTVSSSSSKKGNSNGESTGSSESDSDSSSSSSSESSSSSSKKSDGISNHNGAKLMSVIAGFAAFGIALY